jgi:tryptophanyl-tRNA synthetase
MSKQTLQVSATAKKSSKNNDQKKTIDLMVEKAKIIGSIDLFNKFAHEVANDRSMCPTCKEKVIEKMMEKIKEWRNL